MTSNSNCVCSRLEQRDTSSCFPLLGTPAFNPFPNWAKSGKLSADLTSDYFDSQRLFYGNGDQSSLQPQGCRQCHIGYRSTCGRVGHRLVLHAREQRFIGCGLRGFHGCTTLRMSCSSARNLLRYTPPSTARILSRRITP